MIFPAETGPISSRPLSPCSAKLAPQAATSPGSTESAGSWSLFCINDLVLADQTNAACAGIATNKGGGVEEQGQWTAACCARPAKIIQYPGLSLQHVPAGYRWQ